MVPKGAPPMDVASVHGLVWFYHEISDLVMSKNVDVACWRNPFIYSFIQNILFQYVIQRQDKIILKQ